MKRKMKRISSLLMAVMMVLMIMPEYERKASATEVEEVVSNANDLDLPFTFKDTNYGIINNQVTAKKIEITDDNTKVESVIDNALIILRKTLESGDYDKIYIVGNKGYITSFSVLKSDENWKSVYDYGGRNYKIKNINKLIDDVEYKYFVAENNQYDNIQEKTMPMLYRINNPLTNKYDIIDATNCKYYEYGFDWCCRDSIISENGEYIVEVEKDGKYGLYNCNESRLIYNCVFDDIDLGRNFARGERYYTNDNGGQSSKYTLMTYNGKADENIKYDNDDGDGSYTLEDFLNSKIVICEIAGSDKQELFIYNSEGVLLKYYGGENEHYTYLVSGGNAYVNVKYDKVYKDTYNGGSIIRNHIHEVTNAYIINEDSVIDVNAKFGGEFSEIYEETSSEQGVVYAEIYEIGQELGKYSPDNNTNYYNNSVEWHNMPMKKNIYKF